MYMVPAEDPSMVDFFKGRLTEDPLLQSAATLSARKLRILKDPAMSTARKRSMVQQLNPKINSLIRRMRQLPSGFSSLGKSGDPGDEIEEEEDLVTPVQQKLLQRILKNVTPLKKGKKRADPIFKEEEVTPIKPTGKRKKISKKKLSQQLPFWGEEEIPRPPATTPRELEESLNRALRKQRKREEEKRPTPLAVRRLRTSQGWEPWDPKERTKKRLSYTP